ncbi:MAG: PH domain-containing protein [Candidatus Micrarchaeia archaeon]
MPEELRIRMSGRIYYVSIIVLALLVTAVLGLAPLVLGPLIPYVWMLAFFACAVVYLYVRSHFVEFGEREIHAQTGLINIRSLYAPYANVDNVSINAKLSQRLFGLCELRIDTTGRAETEIIMRNVPMDKAEEAVKLIQEKRAKAPKEGKK